MFKIETLYLLFLFLSVMVHGSQAIAQSFEVKGVTASVSAKSSVEARNKAIDKAQSRAYAKLIGDLEKGGFDTTKAAMLDQDMISGLVKNFEIEEEQFANNTYAGRFTFNFDEQRLRREFLGASLPKSNIDRKKSSVIGKTRSDFTTKNTSKRVLILPYDMRGDGYVLWGIDNNWLQAWLDEKSSTSNITYIIPLGDILDIKDVPNTGRLSFDHEGLVAMMNRYNADHSYIATYGRNRFGRQIVELYDTATGMPKGITNSTYSGDLKRAVNVAQSDLENYLLYGTRTEQMTQEVAKKEQREQMAIPQIQAVHVTAMYPNLGGWLGIQQRLKSVEDISAMNVKSVGAKQAEIRLTYTGELIDLIEVLSKRGLTLNKTAAGNFVLS